MNWNEFKDLLSQLSEPAYLYTLGAVLLVLCVLVLILLNRRQPRRVLAYATENGRVMVSRSAIVELVQTSCEQLKDVSKPNVRIKVKGRITHFDVRIALLSGGRLRSVEQTLQTHLRQALTENLGIENLGKINIVATGFKSGRIGQSSPLLTSERSAPDPTEESFQYLSDSDAADDESIDEKRSRS